MIKIERRALLGVLGASPAAALLSAVEAKAQTTPAPTPAAPGPAGEPARKTPFPGVVSERAGTETTPSFFTSVQFATLKTLSGVLMPPMNGLPGAVEAEAAEFIDFYVGQTNVKPVGRAELRNWYRTGLDDLDARAQQKFGRAFSGLSAAEIDSIIRPMFVAQGSGRQSISVTKRLPFMNEVRNDVRNATINSPQWADALTRANRRAVPALYWKKIDPTIVELN